MADIAMCLNTMCPLADTCYRVQAEPSPFWQSMAPFEYTIATGSIKCDNYWPVGESIADNKAGIWNETSNS